MAEDEDASGAAQPEPDSDHTPDPNQTEPPTTDDKPKEQRKPRASRKKAKPPKPTGAIRNWRDMRGIKEKTFALPILPHRTVVMLCGAKSTFKTFTLNCLLSMKAYGVPWHDGTKTKPGLAFVVTNEDRNDWDMKHSAWLRMMNKPIVDQDGVKLIDPDDESLHHHVATKHGKMLVDRLDLLNLESVKMLIKQVQDATAAEKSTCDILGLDNLASLVPGQARQTADAGIGAAPAPDRKYVRLLRGTAQPCAYEQPPAISGCGGLGRPYHGDILHEPRWHEDVPKN
jgi:hypothetical protein